MNNIHSKQQIRSHNRSERRYRWDESSDQTVDTDKFLRSPRQRSYNSPKIQPTIIDGSLKRILCLILRYLVDLHYGNYGLPRIFDKCDVDTKTSQKNKTHYKNRTSSSDEESVSSYSKSQHNRHTSNSPLRSRQIPRQYLTAEKRFNENYHNESRQENNNNKHHKDLQHHKPIATATKYDKRKSRSRNRRRSETPKEKMPYFIDEKREQDRIRNKYKQQQEKNVAATEPARTRSIGKIKKYQNHSSKQLNNNKVEQFAKARERKNYEPNDRRFLQQKTQKNDHYIHAKQQPSSNHSPAKHRYRHNDKDYQDGDIDCGKDNMNTNNKQQHSSRSARHGKYFHSRSRSPSRAEEYDNYKKRGERANVTPQFIPVPVPVPAANFPMYNGVLYPHLFNVLPPRPLPRYPPRFRNGRPLMMPSQHGLPLRPRLMRYPIMRAPLLPPPPRHMLPRMPGNSMMLPPYGWSTVLTMDAFKAKSRRAGFGDDVCCAPTTAY